MSPEDKIFKQIEDYLNKNLSPEEQEQFAHMLKEDEALANKVNAHEVANEMVIEHKLLSVNNLLQDYHSSQKSIWQNPKLYIAAGLTLAGVLGSLYVFQEPTTQTKHPVAVKEVVPAQVIVKDTSAPQQIAISKTEKIQKKDNIIINDSKVVKEENTVVVLPKDTSSDQKIAVVPQEKPLVQSAHARIEPTIKNIPKDPLQKQNVEKDKCLGVTIVPSVATQSTCKGEHTGKVWLSDCKGGTAPYAFEVYDEHKQRISAQALSDGKYELILTDAVGCITKQNVVIHDKFCDKDYIFNPFGGDVVELPAHHLAGSFKVFDRQGNLHATQQVLPNEKIVWNGQSKYGEIVDGFYNFVVEYSDHTIFKGTITVVR